MKSLRDTASVLWHVEEVLALVREGLRQMHEPDGIRQAAGLQTVIVFGRAITQALQTLRSVEPGFDSWYAPWMNKLAADVVARRFNIMRSQILKEGRLQTHSTVQIVDAGGLRRLAISQAPEEAEEFFLGDNFGRCGWQKTELDGTVSKVFVTLPPSIAVITMHIAGLPIDLLQSPARDVAGQYVAMLSDLVIDAIATFRNSRPPD